jgi:hypothetical protein
VAYLLQPIHLLTLLLTLLILAILMILVFKRELLDRFIEELNNFRGGPPTTPMHPSPAGDVAHLRKPSKKLP